MSHIKQEKHPIVQAIKLMYSFLENKPDYIGDVPIKEIFTWAEKAAIAEVKELKFAQELIAAFQRDNNLPLTEEWLNAHFEREEAAKGKPTTWNDCDDYRDIEVRLYTDSIWTVKVYHLESDTINIIHLCYVGELWSFLSICGVVLTKKNYNETNY